MYMRSVKTAAMKSFLIGWLFVLGIGIPGIAEGQDVKNWNEKLETVFKILRPAERKVVVDGYSAAMTGNWLSPEEKEQVDLLFQELQNLHVTVQPELRNYALCVDYFCRTQRKDNLTVWLKGMKQALDAPERKRTAVRTYLDVTGRYADGQVLYAGGGHRWVLRGPATWSAAEPLRISFENADLLCVTPKDSVVIYATGGQVVLGEEVLQGKGGKVEWREMKDSIRLALSAYRVDMKLSGYTADSVLFYYDSRYAGPLLGQLKDNALKYARKKDTPYPDFVSYARDIRIPALYSGMEYCGGVHYSGIAFRGEGTEEKPACLQIVPNDTICMKLYSRQFLFDSLKILSGKSAMVIGMDSGEITHPNINFVYSVPRNTVTVKRITDQSLHVPFKDTYHRILFDMEEIIWPLDSNYMEMRMSSRSGLFKATIESLNFFSDNIYDNIQGMDEVNPLNGLLKCALALDREVFTLGEYAGFMKKPVDQLRKQVILLSYKDFVAYNENKDEVTLKERLHDYTKARVGKQDYDNIRFSSHPRDTRVNALLDVRNYTLKIMGVEKFTISEARNIYVEPSDKQVMMLKNRDMEFNGRLNAGMFDMYGQHLYFSYEKYRIKLPKVDSTSMYLAGRNKHLRGEKIKSLIRDIAGEIEIDDPANKSGKKEDPGYPVLNSTKESYVYFDDPAIQRGEYKRDSFYFVIQPYTIRGINDASRFRYAFDGTLVSNIVSPIRDTLQLMEDHALGLVYQTPAQGIELYGKGRIRSRMVLNRQGFRAGGKVDLNGSHFHSDSVLMLPTRMLASTPEMKVDEVAGERPAVNGKQLQLKYLPATGNLMATSTTVPFDIYQGRVKHEGTLSVYDRTLDAAGKLKVGDAELNSKLLHLQAAHIRSQSTALSISSISNQDIHLNTSDVRAEIDLLADKGKFVNNRETNRAEFSSSRYSCSFESFTWYMKDAYLNIGIEDEQVLRQLWKIEDPARIPVQGRNAFVSTDPRTDSLNFIAPLARYDLRTGDIACHWVNHIDIANGRFYPGKGDIFIRTGGKIGEFPDGRLLCELTDTARYLTNVRLNLAGRYSFGGSGDYVYVSEEKKKSIIRFTELGTDTARLIQAGVQIGETEALALNDGLRFKGKIGLHSRQPHLFFHGYVGLASDRDYLDHQWMAVRDYLNAAHISIPVKVENKNDKQQRIYNGIFLYTDSKFRPYGAFMSNRQFYKDDLLAGGMGYLEWSAPLKQYVIADTLQNRYYRFRYDPETYRLSAFCPIHLDLGMPGMKQLAAGDILYDLKEEQLALTNLLFLMDFKLLSKMEALFYKDLAEGKTKTIGVSAGLQERLYELYGRQAMPAMQKQLSRNSGNVPDSLNQLLVMDSLNIGWNEKTRSYMASGQVRVKAIGGKPVDKTMQIKLELLRKQGGNQFFVYLYDDRVWYYFEYADRNLYTLSSNAEYNDALRTEKADKKMVQTREKETLYTLTLCPDSKKDRFLGRIGKD